MKKFLILDGNALIHRAFHALPPLKTRQGKVVNAVYGFCSILFKNIKDLEPNYMAVCFDLAGPTFRSLKYKQYKAKRTKAPQELYDQIPIIKKIVALLSIPIFEKQGFEADDIIGTITAENKKHKAKNMIISGDLDLLQLADKNTEIHFLKTGIKQTLVYDVEKIKERYGLSPDQLIDFKALRGDPSDNIPGVTGVGEKTASSLIQKFKSLKNLYRTLETSGLKPQLKARLLEYKEDAFLSYELSEIKRDVPIKFDFAKCLWKEYNKEEVIKILEKLEFRSLIKRLP